MLYPQWAGRLGAKTTSVETGRQAGDVHTITLARHRRWRGYYILLSPTAGLLPALSLQSVSGGCSARFLERKGRGATCCASRKKLAPFCLSNAGPVKAMNCHRKGTLNGRAFGMHAAHT